MSTNSNQPSVPNAREALNKFKMEAASEVGVNLKQGYNGDLTSREAGSSHGAILDAVKAVNVAALELGDGSRV